MRKILLTGVILMMCNLSLHAQTSVYNKVNGINGDVNNDGKVDITDVTYLVNMVLGKKNSSGITPSSPEPEMQGNALVGMYSADINCQIDMAMDDESTATVGFVYSTDEKPTVSSGKTLTIESAKIDEDGAFKVSLTKLTPATKYYYRTYVNQSGMYFYGSVSEFTTLSQTVTVNTGTLSSLTCYSARIANTTINAGSMEYKSIKYGICYSETNEPTIKKNVIYATGTNREDKFNSTIKALKGNTTYYYRAFSTIDNYTTYGETCSFTTKEDNVVETVGSTVDGDDVRVTGNLKLMGGAYSSLSVGVCYCRHDTPTVSSYKETTVDIDEEMNYSIKFNTIIAGYMNYRTYVLIDDVPHYGEMKQLYIEPHKVDMGLSVMWADCNIGAKSPEDYGEYYRWGFTEPCILSKPETWKPGYAKFRKYGQNEKGNANPYQYYYTKYLGGSTEFSYYIVPDTLSRLLPEDEAVIVQLGGKWRMPTRKEISELSDVNKFYIETDYIHNVPGKRFTSKKTGASIFLPFAGHQVGSEMKYTRERGFYWTSDLKNPGNAYYLDIRQNCYEVFYYNRDYPISIRPVYDPSLPDE